MISGPRPERAQSLESTEVPSEYGATKDRPGYFRPEALRTDSAHGTPAFLQSRRERQLRRAAKLCLVSLMGLLAVVLFVHLPRVVQGPARLIRLDTTSISSTRTGVITSVQVARGDRVRVGTALASLTSAEGAREIAAADRLFEQSLLQYLQNPRDPEIVTRVRLARQSLETLREAGTLEPVVSTIDGTVASVYSRPGQVIEASNSILFDIHTGGPPRWALQVQLSNHLLSQLSLPIRISFLEDRDSRRRIWAVATKPGDMRILPGAPSFSPQQDSRFLTRTSVIELPLESTEAAPDETQTDISGTASVPLGSFPVWRLLLGEPEAHTP